MCCPWPCPLLVLPFSRVGCLRDCPYLRELPMLLGCHRDVPTWEEGWVSAYPLHGWRHLCSRMSAGGQGRSGLTLTSIAAGLGTLSMKLRIKSLRGSISATCCRKAKLCFPLNSFYRKIGIMISV